jgi:alpha-1,2-mannosyltransferase
MIETTDGDRPAGSRDRLPRRTSTRTRVTVVVLVIAAVLGGHIWYGNRHHFFDLKIYYHAVNWWAHGHELYAYAFVDEIQGPIGFTYPPFAAILMYPMAWLPLGVVETIMSLGTLVAVIVTTRWLMMPVARRHGWPVWFAMCLAVPLVTMLEPIRETYSFGQINLFIALLILWDLLYLTPRGSRFAGVGIGLATAIKLTPAVFIVYLIASRRVRAGTVAAVTAVGVTLLTAVIMPRDSWRYWTDILFQTNRVGHLDRIPNQSLLGAMSRLADPHRPSDAVWLVLVVVVTGFGLWRAVRATRAGDEVAALTLVGTVGTLISPVSWQHHLYWFVPALIVLLDATVSRVGGWRWYGLSALVAYVTITISVISFFDYGWLAPTSVDTFGGFFVANWYSVLMLLIIAALPIRDRRSPIAQTAQKE